MGSSRLIIEQRGVILGEKNEYYSQIETDMRNLCSMFFKYVSSEEELVETLYTYEPMLILTELTPSNICVCTKMARLTKYKQAVCVGLAICESDSFEKLAEENVITASVVKSDVPRKDSLGILRAYKQFVMYGMNVRTLTKQMPVVTDLIWHDVAWDEKLLYNSISDKLDRLGVKRELAGHRYLIAAIAMQAAIHDAPEPIKLYRNIADYFETSPLAVEKAIRYAIESAWIVGDIDYQHVVFGMSIDEEKGKPTNAEFIARLALDY